MKVKLTSIEDAVARIPSGSSLAIGGSILRRQPNALVRELIRQGKRDLHVLAFASSSAADMLAGAGALARFEGIYVGFFWHGLAPNFRRAVEAGRLPVRDWSESAIVARFRAAGMGVSFLPVKTLLGTDMARRNADLLREMTCPFTGERYHAVAAARPDVALLHGYVADEHGNVQLPVVRDSDDIDQIMAKAAKRVIVTVERIVPHETIRRRPTLTYIPHVWVDAVVHAPFGAHPCACDGFYDEDEDHLALYLESGRDPEAFAAYLDAYVRGPADHAAYLAKVGGRERLARLEVEGEHA